MAKKFVIVSIFFTQIFPRNALPRALGTVPRIGKPLSVTFPW